MIKFRDFLIVAVFTYVTFGFIVFAGCKPHPDGEMVWVCVNSMGRIVSVHPVDSFSIVIPYDADVVCHKKERCRDKASGRFVRCGDVHE